MYPSISFSLHESKTMNIGGAFDALKKGLKVRRKGWNDDVVYLVIVSSDTPEKHCPNNDSPWPSNYLMPIIMFKTDKGETRPWFPIQIDLLKEDWVIYE